MNGTYSPTHSLPTRLLALMEGIPTCQFLVLLFHRAPSEFFFPSILSFFPSLYSYQLLELRIPIAFKFSWIDALNMQIQVKKISFKTWLTHWCKRSDDFLLYSVFFSAPLKLFLVLNNIFTSALLKEAASSLVNFVTFKMLPMCNSQFEN